MPRPIGLRKHRADPGRIATRILFGEMVSHDATTVKNFRDKMELQADFDAVRLIYGVSQNAGLNAANLSITGANVYPVSNTGTSPAFGAIATVTFNGATTGAVNAPSAASRVALLISDWIQLSSIARNDGGTKPLLVVRTNLAAANPLILRGNSSNNTSAWEASTDGRYFNTRRSDTWGTGSSESAWAAGVAGSISPLIGVQYLARGRVITIMANGDSTMQGLGDTRLGAGMPVAVANLLAAESGIPVEVANIGWQGTSMAQIANRAVDYCSARPARVTDQPIKPTFVYQSQGSWNGVPTAGANTELLASDVELNRRGYALALTAWDSLDIPVVTTDWYCFNSAIKDVTSDYRREAYNAEVEAYGINYAPAFASVYGVIDGDGQRQYALGMTTDQAHPNAPGYVVIGAAALPSARAIVGL